ncbi:MAG: feruloyl-CoA synthase [Acidobacteriia bacterium]|nr:feruloyl-CoA synthase [Terriglobia bacterium]
MTTPASVTQRDVRFGPRDVTMTRDDHGVIYVRPVHPLGKYPGKLTEKLDHWAQKAPDRVFMGQRDRSGEWRTLTYAQFRSAARNVAQALLHRNLSPERPIAILSGNDLEHAVLGFAAYYAGIPYAPISTAYSLVSSDFGKLRYIFDLLTPGLVFVNEAAPFRKALDAVMPHDAELVTSFSTLAETTSTADVDRAHDRVTPDTVAKILFTSGSTGTPKGVENTQRMLTSNQEIVRSVLNWVDDEPPVICDWLPWNHTFGGNHDVGFVMYNGGSFYIDEGRPTPAGMAASVRNLQDVGPNVYLNVPKGFEALIPFLRERRDFRERFFSRVKMFYYAGAGLLQPVWDELDQLAVETCGERIMMFTGLGSTETGPAALFPGKDLRRAGEVGLPASGVELKLVPVGDKLEARLRSPSITPGYWRQPDLTRLAFDDEGFYRIGDALRFVDPNDISRGFMFDGRIVEDFKLSTGTFVSTGPLRGKFLSHCAPYAHDAVIAGHDRDFVTVLVFPALDACRELAKLPSTASAAETVTNPALHAKFQALLNELAAESTGSSNRIARAILMPEPPSIDAHEVTDKGSLNQGAVLKNRGALVLDLYSPRPSARVISIQKGA